MNPTLVLCLTLALAAPSPDDVSRQAEAHASAGRWKEVLVLLNEASAFTRDTRLLHQLAQKLTGAPVDARVAVPTRPVEAALAGFLRGSVPASAVMTTTRDAVDETDAHAVIGLAALPADPALARTHCAWIRDQGPCRLVLGRIAVATLARGGNREAIARMEKLDGYELRAADLAWLAGRREEAARLYKAQVSDAKPFPLAARRRGEVLLELGRPQLAVQALWRARRQQQEEWGAASDEAIEASALLERACREAGDARANAVAADLAAARKRREEARALHYAPLPADEKRLEDHLEGLASRWLELGDHARALRASTYLHGDRSEPRPGDGRHRAARLWGLLAMRRQRPEEALQYLEFAANPRLPQYDETLADAGRAAVAALKQDAGRRLLTELVKRQEPAGPLLFTALHLRARLELGCHLVDEALADFERCLAILNADRAASPALRAEVLAGMVAVWRRSPNGVPADLLAELEALEAPPLLKVRALLDAATANKPLDAERIWTLLESAPEIPGALLQECTRRLNAPDRAAALLTRVPPDQRPDPD